MGAGMNVLAVELRKRLERAISNAREVAEAGARAALEALAVPLRQPYEHLNPEMRSLRRRLRAHGRQLGDRLDPRSGMQSIDRLVHECAYEHWHGMLFARFLAENNLLIASEWGDVSVSLKDCEELGKDEGLDQWAMAARFAHQMLPQVFRPARIPPSRSGLRTNTARSWKELIESLPTDVFAASDSARLGLSVLAVQEEGRGEPFRGQDRCGRTAGGDTAIHRALHGGVSSRQHVGRVVGGASPERRGVEWRHADEMELRAQGSDSRCFA